MDLLMYQRQLYLNLVEYQRLYRRRFAGRPSLDQLLAAGGLIKWMSGGLLRTDMPLKVNEQSFKRILEFATGQEAELNRLLRVESERHREAVAWPWR
jgi:hypothetical protein